MDKWTCECGRQFSYRGWCYRHMKTGACRVANRGVDRLSLEQHGEFWVWFHSTELELPGPVFSKDALFLIHG
jgi:hypothetical protein